MSLELRRTEGEDKETSQKFHGETVRHMAAHHNSITAEFPVRSYGSESATYLVDDRSKTIIRLRPHEEHKFSPGYRQRKIQGGSKEFKVLVEGRGYQVINPHEIIEKEHEWCEVLKPHRGVLSKLLHGGKSTQVLHCHKKQENPIRSAAQYGMMQAIASGTSTTGHKIPRHVAQRLIDETPHQLRSRYAEELAEKKRHNPVTGDRVYAVGDSQLIMEGKGLTQSEAVALLRRRPMNDMGMHNFIYKFQGTLAGDPTWKRVTIQKRNPDVLDAQPGIILMTPVLGDYPALDEAHTYAQHLSEQGRDVIVVCQKGLDNSDHYFVAENSEQVREQLGVPVGVQRPRTGDMGDETLAIVIPDEGEEVEIVENPTNPQDYMQQAFDYGFREGEAVKQHDRARKTFIHDSYRRWLHMATTTPGSEHFPPPGDKRALEDEWSRGYQDGVSGGFKNPETTPYDSDLGKVRPVVLRAQDKLWYIYTYAGRDATGSIVRRPVGVGYKRRESALKVLRTMPDARVGLNPNVPVKFRDIQIGEEFEFDPGRFGLSAYGPWIKTGSRMYRATDGRPHLQKVKVGSIDAKVQRPPYDYSPKRNPNDGFHESSAAADLSEEFHGRPSGDVIEVTEREHYRSDLAVLGDLVELVIATPTGYEVTITFDYASNEFPVKLCSSADRRQLYIEGGDQDIDDLLGKWKMDGDKWKRDLMVLGEWIEVTYRTEKGFDKFKLISYYHQLGEETDIQPVMLYDWLNKKLIVAGGQYSTERDGIIN